MCVCVRLGTCSERGRLSSFVCGKSIYQRERKYVRERERKTLSRLGMCLCERLGTCSERVRER